MANLRSPTVKSYLAAFGIGGRFGVPVRRARTESAASENGHRCTRSSLEDPTQPTETGFLDRR
jgi:hypothetical protein